MFLNWFGLRVFTLVTALLHVDSVTLLCVPTGTCGLIVFTVFTLLVRIDSISN